MCVCVCRDFFLSIFQYGSSDMYFPHLFPNPVIGLVRNACFENQLNIQFNDPMTRCVPCNPTTLGLRRAYLLCKSVVQPTTSNQTNVVKCGWPRGMLISLGSFENRIVAKILIVLKLLIINFVFENVIGFVLNSYLIFVVDKYYYTFLNKPIFFNQIHFHKHHTIFIAFYPYWRVTSYPAALFRTRYTFKCTQTKIHLTHTNNKIRIKHY